MKRLRTAALPLLLVLVPTLAMCVAFCVALCAPAAPLTRYTLWIDADPDTHTVSISQSVVWRNDVAPIEQLLFQCYPLAYGSDRPLPISAESAARAYPRGADYARFRLQSVDADRPISYELDADDALLRISFARPLPVGHETTFRFCYEIDLPYNLLRLGYTERDMRITGCYLQLCPFLSGTQRAVPYAPIGDPIVNERADYAVTFCVPDGYAYACSGVSSSYVQDGETLVRAQARGIRDFALALSQGTRHERMHDGIPIAYLASSDDDPARTLDVICRALDVYTRLYGAYPYDGLQIAQTPFVAGGMEYGAFALIADDLSDAAHETVLAHEIAHQWWYGAVGNDAYEHAWMDEGLAQYATYRYYLAVDMPSYAAYFARASRDAYDLYLQSAPDLRGALSMPLDRYASELDYTRCVYDKGLLLWLQAETLFGEETVRDALRAYRDRCGGAIATPDDLWQALDETREGAGTLLRQWAIRA